MDVKGKEGWAPASHVVIKKSPKVIPQGKIYKFVAREITNLSKNYIKIRDLRFNFLSANKTLSLYSFLI